MDVIADRKHTAGYRIHSDQGVFSIYPAICMVPLLKDCYGKYHSSDLIAGSFSYFVPLNASLRYRCVEEQVPLRKTTSKATKNNPSLHFYRWYFNCHIQHCGGLYVWKVFLAPLFGFYTNDNISKQGYVLICKSSISCRQ